jgi:hypothetical protein
MSSIDSGDIDSTDSSLSDLGFCPFESDTDNICSSQSDTDSIHPIQNDLPSEVKLMIHHQFPNIELVSPMYAGEGVVRYLLPDQNIDTGSTIEAYFSTDLNQDESISILMCKLERKDNDEINGGT